MGRCEPYGADHSYGVLNKPRAGIADGTDKALLKVAQARTKVDDREIGNIVSQRVDGEVTAESILFGRPEDIVHENHSVLVLDVAGAAMRMGRFLYCVRHVGGQGGSAESGYFQNLILKMNVGES